MRKIKVWCDNGANCQSRYEEEFEIEDDTTEDEVSQIVKEWALERYEYGIVK